MKFRLVLPALATVLLASGCTWVSVSPQAKQQGVMVLPQDRVASCRLLEKTQVSVVDKFGIIERMPQDVEHDLQNLAMNQAASAGGDTVSPLSPVNNGNQTFGVYKCLNSGGGSQVNTAPAAGTSAQTTPYQPPR